MMNIPRTFSAEHTLQEQILYALTLLKRATAEQITKELAKLKRITNEKEAIALNADVQNALHQMYKEQYIKQLTEKDNKVHYFF